MPAVAAYLAGFGFLSRLVTTLKCMYVFKYLCVCVCICVYM